MALPKVTSTVYEMIIPSTKERVKFRPFLVKEQKALLMAQQNDDVKVMVNTLKDVIVECVLDKIDIDALALFDLEYMLLQLRAKSVQEKAELLFVCDACEKETQISFDVSNIEVTFPKDHTNKIDLGNDIGIMMKYPPIDLIKKLEGINSSDMDAVFEVVLSCIDYIYDADQVYYTKEQTKEDVTEFLNSLTSEQFNKLKAFFETMPRLEHKVEFRCPHCGHDHNKVMTGINNFF